MSGVTKIRDSYSNDSRQAKISTREQFTIIVSNMELLETVDRFGNHEKFLDEITEEVENGVGLRDWQIARIEKIYELVMKAAGLPHVDEHKDKRRKGLRFG